ncbi:MAG: hypothetical protein AAF456_13455 [Planctomycetota bacterium]
MKKFTLAIALVAAAALVMPGIVSAQEMEMVGGHDAGQAAVGVTGDMAAGGGAVGGEIYGAQAYGGEAYGGADCGNADCGGSCGGAIGGGASCGGGCLGGGRLDYGCGGARCASGGCGSGSCYFCRRWGFSGGGSYNEDGEITAVGCVRNNPALQHYWAHRDSFSPNPHYAYSDRGVEAALTHQWNRQMAGQHSWHDNYEYWRWGQPTALVVPPTAAFQSHYAWGVGQTQSRPIYHQFGMGGGYNMGGGAGMYNKAPYWPSNTDQYGVYPVRGPF